MTPLFLFSQGIYLSHDAVLQNQPDLTWEEIEADLACNPASGLARLAALQTREGQKVAPEDVFALCRDSLLYVRVEDPEVEKEVQLFGALLTQGSLCLYRYEKEETRMVTIKAYNPLTGKPFRSGQVPRKEWVERWKLFNLETGATADLTHKNLFEWIGNDTELAEQARSMPEEDLDMGRLIQAYNRRNPVFVVAKRN